MFLKLVAFSYLIVVAIATVNARKSKIIGGDEADPHEFPHMVSLDRDEVPQHFCGGAIIDERWIITAAHCLAFVPKGQTFRVKAGKHSLGTIEPSEQVVNVEKSFPHKGYPGGKIVAAHDIALLKLEKALIFNKYVQPIVLPKKKSVTNGKVVFSGWGNIEFEKQPDKLRRGHFSIIDLDSCRKADINTYGPPSAVTHTNLCTGSSNGVFACTGDSGSALIKQRFNRKNELVGIFSWLASPCGTEGAPSVFTKVSLYVDWIQSIIAYN